MKKDEIISMLQQQNVFLQQQLGEANRKVDELLRKVSPLESAIDFGTASQTEPKPREKTNYGARRKEHYEAEVEEEDVNPTDPRFDEMKARLIDTLDRRMDGREESPLEEEVCVQDTKKDTQETRPAGC